MTGSKIKIIIVEDEGIFALDLKYKMTKWGYKVTSLVNNYNAAISSVKEDTPHLALMDINIKGAINGIETARDLKELFNIPSLFISSQNDSLTMEKITVIRPVGFILKPVNDSLLLQMIMNFQKSYYKY